MLRTIVVVVSLLLSASCNVDGISGHAQPDARTSADTRTATDAATEDQSINDLWSDVAVTAAPRVLLRTTKGDIVVELSASLAPITTANFLQYVKGGHYDGLIFHRVIAGFMIQGGGFDQAFAQRATKAPIVNEAGNGLTNVRGSIAMARTSVVDSATSQFFINLVDNAFLDHQDQTAAGFGYAVFGSVVEGMDVVDAIAAMPTGAKGPFSKDVPQTDVIITQAGVQ